MSFQVRRSLVVFSTLVAAAPCAFAGVLVVSPSGPFTDLQAALTSANDGDIVLVKSGTYPSFTVTDKSLVVVADAGATVSVLGNVRVENLASTRAVSLSGLIVDGQPAPVAALSLENNAGPVRIQDCTFRGSFEPLQCSGGAQVGARVSSCVDVALTNCTFVAGEPDFVAVEVGEAPGLVVSGSRVALGGCTAVGGYGGHALCMSGGPRPGAAAVNIVAGGEVWLLATTCSGGAGGEGWFIGNAGGAGGPGVALDSSATMHTLGSNLSGGAGGSAHWVGPQGPGPNGAPGVSVSSAVGAVVVNHAGAGRVFEASTVVRASTSRSFTFGGVAGDRVALYASRFGDWNYDALVNWVRSVGTATAARIVRHGSVPGSGVLNVTVPVGALAPGIDATWVQMQSVHRDLGGALFFGPPRFTVIVDPSF